MKIIHLIIMSIMLAASTVYGQNSGISMGNAIASGAHSFAAGDSTKAEGVASLAFGAKVLAQGDYGFSAGKGTKAIGQGSAAFGLNTTAYGSYSVAMGEQAYAGGYGSIAIGELANTGGNGYGAVALGTSSANSPYALSAGINNIAFPGSNGSALFGGGNHSHAEAVLMAGAENAAFSYGETVVGQFSVPDSFGTSFSSIVPTDRLFTIGNGENSSNRSNALVMLKNGNTEMSGNLDVQKRLTIGEDNLVVEGHKGQIRFNSTNNDFEGHDGNSWKSLTKSARTTTGSGTVSDIDGNQYLTVTIGSQTWMRENLRTSRYSNGDPITEVLLNSDWSTLTTEAWSWYDHDPEKDNPYGKLYNWYAVDDTRNLCPSGWHIPTNEEWIILVNLLGDNPVAGGKMKATGTIQAETGYWESPNTAATNESGFTGLPGGVRKMDGTFSIFGSESVWWTSTDVPFLNTAISYHIRYDDDGIVRDDQDEKQGCSIRCIKD